MNTALRLSAIAAAFAPVSAFAHAGAHDHVEGGLVAHMLESPFHLGVVALALGFAAYGVAQLAVPALRKSRRDRD
ncbi:MAG: hypothetical protein Kow0026_28600 [Oricola sp.]